jgi:hypothetical protein
MEENKSILTLFRGDDTLTAAATNGTRITISGIGSSADHRLHRKPNERVISLFL